jgi:hypothetical protein
MRADTSPFHRNAESTERPEAFQNPAAALIGLAIGIGIVLGVMKARRSYRSSHDAAPKLPLRERSAKFAQVMNTWEQISDALLGVATAKAIDAIAERIPGFRDQYERQEAMRGPFRSMDAVPRSR